MTKLKVLSLFSGIGMFDYGLEKTGGFETIAFCEQDKHCQEVLKKHWLEVPQFKDITKVNVQQCYPYSNETVLMDQDELNEEEAVPTMFYHGEIDVVTASWPCQGHSVAGKKKGLNDERSGLWKEVKRILQETQPGWFIGENSANLRTNGLTEVLQDLWEVGYRDIRWDVLPAESYGALHKRERIYIVANRHGIRLCDQTFTPSKKEQVRRAEAWIAKLYGLSPDPRFYRMVDGHPIEVDKDRERVRKQRVKQCGNSLYWPIVEKIGNYILTLEKQRNNQCLSSKKSA